ncbi:MAG: ABC transporter permease, partial [Muribaculaceae bacterium]|nr:ABC transporter permease [Muribaculaceae bacterium]
MKSALSIIISREYLERVKRKSFIISTLLIPIFMVAMMFAPALIMIFNEPERASVAVIDDTGVIASHLKDSEEIS